VNFFDGDNFSSTILLSGNLPERCRFPAGDVLPEISIGRLILHDGIEFENEPEFRTLLLLAAAERHVRVVCEERVFIKSCLM
jgi:hypothetical protein